MAAKKLLDLGSSEPQEKTADEVVEIFKQDGKVYSIPKELPFSAALEYMEAQVEHGPDGAAFIMLRSVLGKEAFNALKNNPNLTEEQFNEIFQTVEKHVLAGKDDSGK
jgi:hypothetical protein